MIQQISQSDVESYKVIKDFRSDRTKIDYQKWKNPNKEKRKQSTDVSEVRVPATYLMQPGMG